ncbi:MAG: phosphoribosyltransferase [Bacillota bacterium]
MFVNRYEAGLLLREKIKGKKLINPLVVGVPRGGIVVAAPLAELLDAPLKVIISKKIGLPRNEEVAMGAITPGGEAIVDWVLAKRAGLTDSQVEMAISKARTEWELKKEKYLPWWADDFEDRDVILVDDGIATGYTIKVIVNYLKEQPLLRLWLAIPVLPEEKLEEFLPVVDQLVYLKAPSDFYAVGQFYQDFSQVEEDEVLRYLS